MLQFSSVSHAKQFFGSSLFRRVASLVLSGRKSLVWRRRKGSVVCVLAAGATWACSISWVSGKQYIFVTFPRNCLVCFPHLRAFLGGKC